MAQEPGRPASRQNSSKARGYVNQSGSELDELLRTQIDGYDEMPEAEKQRMRQEFGAQSGQKQKMAM